MRVISPRRLREFYSKPSYRDARAPLKLWLSIAADATWRNLAEVRKDFPHADGIVVASRRTVVCFNVGGNKYRLITAIHYNTGIIFVLRILTHRQYDMDPWKEQS